MLMGFAIAAPVMVMIAIRACQIARLAMEIGRDESLSLFHGPREDEEDEELDRLRQGQMETVVP